MALFHRTLTCELWKDRLINIKNVDVDKVISARSTADGRGSNGVSLSADTNVHPTDVASSTAVEDTWIQAAELTSEAWLLWLSLSDRATLVISRISTSQTYFNSLPNGSGGDQSDFEVPRTRVYLTCLWVWLFGRKVSYIDVPLEQSVHSSNKKKKREGTYDLFVHAFGYS